MIDKRLVLTKRQTAAFESFKRALARCSESGIRFYVVLKDIHAVNGKYVEYIDFREGKLPSDCVEISSMDLPYITHPDFCSWADDPHYAKMRSSKLKVKTEGK